MKLHMLFMAIFISASAFSQTGKPCEDLKTEIAKKIEANGVKTYTLEIVAKDKDAEGKVVGTCEGGTRKIVYRRARPGDQAQAKTDKQTANAGR